MSGRGQPERTCIGCRQKGPRLDLIRIVRRPDGEVRLDPSGREPGRGAYVHPIEACLTAAARQDAVSRALRTPLSAARAATLVKDLERVLGDERA